MLPAHKQRRLNRQLYFSDRENWLKVVQGIKKESCPHCSSSQIVKYGKYRDRQRYKCNDCSRTFNDHTNTPMHRTKYPQKWLQFLECLIYGYSLRRTAVRIGVSWVTAFYWRHKMINALQIVENDHYLDHFWKGGLRPYLCVKQNPPWYAVYPEERETFKIWISSFDWIAQKYLKRYIAWFRLVEKTESLLVMEKRMKRMLSVASSVQLEQTYQNVRMAS